MQTQTIRFKRASRRIRIIANKLECDRFGLAKYPRRMAYRQCTPFAYSPEHNEAWIRANRLPHPENDWYSCNVPAHFNSQGAHPGCVCS